MRQYRDRYRCRYRSGRELDLVLRPCVTFYFELPTSPRYNFTAFCRCYLPTPSSLLIDVTVFHYSDGGLRPPTHLPTPRRSYRRELVTSKKNLTQRAIQEVTAIHRAHTVPRLLYSIQRYTAIHYTAIQRYTLYTLYTIPLGCHDGCSEHVSTLPTYLPAGRVRTYVLHRTCRCMYVPSDSAHAR